MIVKHSHEISKSKRPTVNSYPFYSPRFWNGMRAGDYANLLYRNRFRVHPLRWPMMGLVSGCTVVNSVLASLQRLVYSKRISQTELVKPPVFVIGHWRSGTTLLQDILAQDKRFSFSSTYDCFLPHHFLVSKWFLGPMMRLLMPNHRPMDNMETGASMPQEDEFALCGLNVPTPYFRIAFCNQEARDIDLLNFKNSDPQTVEQIREAFTQFYKALTLRDKKQLVLKSPTHTGRIETLAKWFPGAKFIHISRHPHQVIPSTMRLWQSLDHVQSFQIPKYSDAELLKYVFNCFDKMYEGYIPAADKMQSNELIEIKYEDLVAKPLSVIESIYSQLELDDFSECREDITQLLSSRKDYRPNTQPVEAELREQVDSRCAEYVERFDYHVRDYASV